jgi:hypothetical protein
MKIRKINIVEIALFFLFSAGYFLQRSNVMHHWAWVILLFFMLLGILYFPLGFYTLKSPKFSVIYSIIFGMLFSLSLTAILSSLMKVDISIVLLLILIVLYLMAASIQAVSYYFFSKTEGQIIMYDYGITIRYLVFFSFMLYALLTYNFRA